MKKLIVFCAMIVALGFVATGCAKKSKTVTAPAEPAVEAPADTEAEAPAEDAS